MERLTEKHFGAADYYMSCSENCGSDDEMCASCPELDKIINRLGAYEDTGLEPEEIESLASTRELSPEAEYAIDKHADSLIERLDALLHKEDGELAKYRSLGSLDHLCKLVQAEKDGLLVALLAKNGDTIYVKGIDKVVECYIMETYLDDQKGIEYFVSFKCEYLETDNACKGCPFYGWKQDYSGEWSCDGEYGQSCVIAADIGKTVFLTRKEAEAALEAQKGGDEG